MKRSSHELLPKVAARRNGWFCTYCQNPVRCACPRCVPDVHKMKSLRRSNPEIVATIDHLQARQNGGTFGLHNLVIACSRCNGIKSAIDLSGLEEPITLEVLIREREKWDSARRDRDAIQYADVRRRARKRRKKKTMKTLVSSDEPEPFNRDAEAEKYRLKQAQLLAELRFALDEVGRPFRGFQRPQTI